ncbi:hypothetical protein [Providencia sneebia]|uniref:Uncharacterized protein n=1 Tax=Providencia sneebia DSM 19967 TaxID=1141660 RepID=K8WA01_9GAMM|nr:hypothetical protein OO7_08800 [Providencia sneebia DSM 19967]
MNSDTPPPTGISIASPEYIEKVKRYHDDNFNAVNSALESIEKQLRKSLSKNDESGELTFTRIYTMMLGVWCEARLHKLLYEKNVFSEYERSVVYNTSSLGDRWKAALELGLKKYCKLSPEDKISNKTVTFSVLNMYKEIQNWISDYFLPAFTLRNKIAHGQWIKPFTNTQSAWVDTNNFNICGYLISSLYGENVLTTTIKVQLIKEISVTINNLAVDSDIYKVEDFDIRYKEVSTIIEKLKQVDYPAFKKNIGGTFKHPS